MVSRTIAGAALDVLEQEASDANDPLLQVDNAIITPQAGTGSLEAGVQLRCSTAQNVVDMLSGKLSRSIVNRKALGW